VPKQPDAVPSAVRTSFRLLIVGVVLAVCDLIASLLALAHFHAALPAYLALVGPLRSIEDVLASSFQYAIFISAVPVVLLPLCLAVYRQGRPAARIVTWWVAGVVLAILSVGIIDVPDVSGLIDPTGTETVPEALISAQRALLPAWYTSLHQIAMVALTGVLIAIVILLARESAAEYFRRQRVGEDRGLWTFVDETNNKAGLQRQSD
jgi:hypothetical protein